MESTTDAPAGLEGVVVAQTGVGDVRGHEGFFHYRGHPAPRLATDRSIEEVWHLLHHGRLPDERELRAFIAETSALGHLPAAGSADKQGGRDHAESRPPNHCR